MQSENWGFNLNVEEVRERDQFAYIPTCRHTVRICLQLVRKRRSCFPNVRLIWWWVAKKATVNESIKQDCWVILDLLYDPNQHGGLKYLPSLLELGMLWLVGGRWQIGLVGCWLPSLCSDWLSPSTQLGVSLSKSLGQLIHQHQAPMRIFDPKSEKIVQYPPFPWPSQSQDVSLVSLRKLLSSQPHNTRATTTTRSW